MKNKISFSIDQKLLNEAKMLANDKEYSSLSEFVEKAVQYYVMHLHLKNNEDYFGGVVANTLKSMIDRLGDRITKMQFKNAVVTEKLAQILSFSYNLDEEDYERLNEIAKEEVMYIQGRWRDDYSHSISEQDDYTEYDKEDY